LEQYHRAFFLSACAWPEDERTAGSKRTSEVCSEAGLDGGRAAGRARLHKLAGGTWACYHGPTQHVNRAKAYAQQHPPQPFGALLPPLDAVFPPEGHIVSLVQRVVFACNVVIDCRVIVFWNKGPAPTTAANTTPSFNLALFLRIARPSRIRPTILLLGARGAISLPLL
jgi:hypothetical protein